MVRIAAIDVNGKVLAPNNVSEQSSVDHYAILDDHSGKKILTFDLNGHLKGTSELGTSSTDKVGFFGVTPIVQPAAQVALSGTATGTDATMTNAMQTRVNLISTVLHNLGLIG